MRFRQAIVPVGSRRHRVLRRLAFKGPIDPVMPRWNRWARRHSNVFFVQIGSHEGRAGDPLCAAIDRHLGWRGVMVEPVPEVFGRLSAHRHGPRFELVQAAVTDHDGTTTMVLFEDSVLDTSQLGSLEPAMSAKYEPRFRQFAIEVPAVTFGTLTRGLDEIDVLHVDAEGHDAKILSQVDFDRWALRAVMFEHMHLEGDERQATEERLRRHGYRLWSNNWDTLALR
jgi:FkbM family methyltransferase